MVEAGGELIALPQIPTEIRRLQENLQILTDLLRPQGTKAYAVLLNFEQSTKPNIAVKTGN